MNVFPAHVSIENANLRFHLHDGLELSYNESDFAQPVRERMLEYRDVVIGVRPYAVHRAPMGAAGMIVANQWLGDQSHIAASFAGKTIVLVEHDRTAGAEGELIFLKIQPSDLHVFDPASGQALSHGQELA